MTSPLAHPPVGAVLLGATHDEELTAWPSSSADARAMGIRLGIFKADPDPATVTSAPELEVWRHRDGGAG